MLQEQKANSPEFCTTNFYTCGISMFYTIERREKFKLKKTLYRYFWGYIFCFGLGFYLMALVFFWFGDWGAGKIPEVVSFKCNFQRAFKNTIRFSFLFYKVVKQICQGESEPMQQKNFNLARAVFHSWLGSGLPEKSQKSHFSACALLPQWSRWGELLAI